MKDYFGYKDKVCVVTGAASGMGKATCEVLVDMGAEVYGLDIATGDMPGVKYVQVDLCSKESIDAAFEQLPTNIYGFFAAAGVAGNPPGFQKTFYINFLSNKHMLDVCLLSRMEKGGAIAFVSSLAGNNWEIYSDEFTAISEAKDWDEAVEKLNEITRGDLDGGRGYQLSKRALVYHAMKMVPEYSKHDVRINVMMPGSTRSAMTEKMIADGIVTEEELLKTTGLAGRFAETREMAEPLAFLNSNMASFINGNILRGDYGELAMINTGLIESQYLFSVLEK